MLGRREQRKRERKRAMANCQKLNSFFPLAKRQTSQCVETQTTSSASTVVDSAASACNSSSLLELEASADKPDTNVDVVEDQDCHLESKEGEEQSELSEPNDCLAAAGECQPCSKCSSRDTYIELRHQGNCCRV